MPTSKKSRAGRKRTKKALECEARISKYVKMYMRETRDDAEDAVSDMMADLMHFSHIHYPKYGHSHANQRRARLAFEDEADPSWRRWKAE